MSVRELLAAAAITVAVLVSGVGSAGAATTLLRLDPGNTAFSGASGIGNTTSDGAILATNVGNFTCQQSALSADLENPGFGAETITGTLTSLTFTSCADDGAPVNFSSCQLHVGSAPPRVHLAGGAVSGTVARWPPVCAALTARSPSR